MTDRSSILNFPLYRDFFFPVSMYYLIEKSGEVLF